MPCPPPERASHAVQAAFPPAASAVGTAAGGRRPARYPCKIRGRAPDVRLSSLKGTPDRRRCVRPFRDGRTSPSGFGYPWFKSNRLHHPAGPALLGAPDPGIALVLPFSAFRSALTRASRRIFRISRQFKRRRLPGASPWVSVIWVSLVRLQAIRKDGNPIPLLRSLPAIAFVRQPSSQTWRGT